MEPYVKRLAWYTASVSAILFYNVWVIDDYKTASDPLKSFSTATETLNDPETHFSFGASGFHDIWLLLPKGTPAQQTVQSRDEIVRGMSATLDGKRLELTDSRVSYLPETLACGNQAATAEPAPAADVSYPPENLARGNDTLTYLTTFDADGEVKLTVKTIHRGVVPIGSKVVVETSPAESDGKAIGLWLSTILRNNLGITDAVAALVLLIIGIVDFTRSRNRSIIRPRG